MTRRWRIVASLLSVALLAGLMATGNAHAATVRSHPTFIMQNDDLANLTAIGVTDTFGYTLCNLPAPDGSSGPAAGPAENIPAEQSCTAGQVPHFANELGFAEWAKTAPRNSYALLDLEGWTLTPANERANIPAYTCDGAKTAVKYGIRLIAAPVTTLYSMAAADAEAAKCGAWGVDEQIQDHVGTTTYTLWALRINAAVRAASRTTKVFAGLGTDAEGTPRTAFELIEDWNSVKAHVYGAWLNVVIWAPPAGKGCAAVNGCAVIGEGFLNYLDGVT